MLLHFPMRNEAAGAGMGQLQWRTSLSLLVPAFLVCCVYSVSGAQTRTSYFEKFQALNSEELKIVNARYCDYASLDLALIDGSGQLV